MFASKTFSKVHLKCQKDVAHKQSFFKILYSQIPGLNEISFMHKYVNNKVPNSFSNKFVKLSNFDRSVSFQLEVVKKSFLKTLPAYSMPKHWNSLPLELKRVASLLVFSKIDIKRKSWIHTILLAQ